MRIHYIANARIPTEKAHGVQIMHTCEALADRGCTINLVIPKRNNPLVEDPFTFYRVKPIFLITRLWSFDRIGPKGFGYSLGFLLQSYTFAFRAFLYLMRMSRTDIVYGRDILTLTLLSLCGRQVFFEAHTAESSFSLGLARRAAGVVVITANLKNFFVSHGIDGQKISVIPDGVDLALFTSDISKGEARRRLQLPEDKKIAVYTGHLYAWKGVYTLAKAAEKLGDDSLVVFVGGTSFNMPHFLKEFGASSAIRIIGQRPYEEIPLYLKAADVLVLPNSSKEDISRLYTSPLKLFEYMASERPIIASDLPSIREVLTEEAALLVPPDDPENLALSIKAIFLDPGRGEQLAKVARAQVSAYDWSKRAERIVDFLSIHGAQ